MATKPRSTGSRCRKGRSVWFPRGAGTGSYHGPRHRHYRAGIVPAGAVPSFITVPAGSGARLSREPARGNLPMNRSHPSPSTDSRVQRYPRTFRRHVLSRGLWHGRRELLPCTGFSEEFTVAEQLPIRWCRLGVGIHLWQGQSLPEIFAPLVVVLIGGLVAVWRSAGRGQGVWPGLPPPPHPAFESPVYRGRCNDRVQVIRTVSVVHRVCSGGPHNPGTHCSPGYSLARGTCGRHPVPRADFPFATRDRDAP